MGSATCRTHSIRWDLPCTQRRRDVRVMMPYFAGTETCAVRGSVCPNDVAVIRLVPKHGAHPGTNTGWCGHGWNGYDFNSSCLTHVTQIGYPVCLDSGALRQRNDSHGLRSASNSNSTVIGAPMCGGSSGGSWLVNFGVRPILSGTAFGSARSHESARGRASGQFGDPARAGAPVGDLHPQTAALLRGAGWRIPQPHQRACDAPHRAMAAGSHTAGRSHRPPGRRGVHSALRVASQRPHLPAAHRARWLVSG